MATPLFLYKFNEAASGTTPTTLVDSAASPLNAALTYSTGSAWTTNAGGDALTPGSSAGGVGAAGFLVTGVSKLRTALNGAKQISYEAQEFVTSLTTGNDGVSLLYCDTNGTVDVFGLDRIGPTSLNGYAIATNTAADGDNETKIANAQTGYCVVQAIIDTSLASNRRKLFINGFLVGQDSNNVTQNTTFVFAGGAGTERLFGALPVPSGSYNQGFAAIYASALTASNCLSNALRLFANNDSDPNLGAAQLRQAGTNGGTNDASTSAADPTVAPTQTVGASGLNRGLFAIISGAAVSTGVTACTFNSVAGTKVTSQLSSTMDVEVWWWNDGALPAAGTYSGAITVDGATGTAAATFLYLEGVSQSAPTNFGLANNTSTSITATLASSASGGSIIIAGLLDVTTGDAATDGANQLPISAVNGTSTGNTHKHQTSAKYVPVAGANSMSWSGLTTASVKVAVAVEVLPAAGIAPSAPRIYGPAPLPALSRPEQSYYTRTRFYPSSAPAAGSAASSAPTLSVAATAAAIAAAAGSAAPSITGAATSSGQGQGAGSSAPTTTAGATGASLAAGAGSSAPSIAGGATSGATTADAPRVHGAKRLYTLYQGYPSVPYYSGPQIIPGWVQASGASGGASAPSDAFGATGAALAAGAGGATPSIAGNATGAELDAGAGSASPSTTGAATSAALKASPGASAPPDNFAAAGARLAAGAGSSSPPITGGATGAETGAGAGSSAPTIAAGSTGASLDAAAGSSAPPLSGGATGTELAAGAGAAAPSLTGAASAATPGSAGVSAPPITAGATGQETSAGAGSAAPPITVGATGAELGIAAGGSAPTVAGAATSAALKAAAGASAPSLAGAATGQETDSGSGSSAAPVTANATSGALAAVAGSSAPPITTGAVGQDLAAGGGSSAPSISGAATGQSTASGQGAGSSAPAITAGAVGQEKAAGAGSSAPSLAAGASGQASAAGVGAASPSTAGAATGQEQAAGAGASAPTLGANAASAAGNSGAGASAPPITVAAVAAAIKAAAGASTPSLVVAASSAGSSAGAGSSAPSLSAAATASAIARTAGSSLPSLAADAPGRTGEIAAASSVPPIAANATALPLNAGSGASTPLLNCGATSAWLFSANANSAPTLAADGSSILPFFPAPASRTAPDDGGGNRSVNLTTASRIAPGDFNVAQLQEAA